MASVIRVKVKGNYNKTEKLLERLKVFNDSLFIKYGELGVQRLSEYTPSKSGDTKMKWTYEIEKTAKGAKIIFSNENAKIIIWTQYGHAGPNGSWVQGNDFVNPAMDAVCEQLANELSMELSEK